MYFCSLKCEGIGERESLFHRLLGMDLWYLVASSQPNFIIIRQVGTAEGGALCRAMQEGRSPYLIKEMRQGQNLYIYVL